MSPASAELFARGVHALRRAALWWALGLAAFMVLNAAFWPSLEGSAALEGFEDMGSLLEAFGAQDLTSPGGYLDGQVFAFTLPMLVSGMAIAHVTAVTAGDEDAGRLELLHALPVSRRAVWFARWTSAAAVLGLVSAVTAGTIAACIPAFSFDGVPVGRVVAATAACGLLAGFHGSVAYLAGCLGASRGRAVALTALVAIAGYVANFVLPIADGLRAARRGSPWYWALGDQPVVDGVDLPRLLLLAAVTAGLVWAGTLAIDRRDIRSA